MSATTVTWTDLANQALTRINQDRINSIDDTTVLAGRIRDMRVQVATEVLEEHDWGSATKRALLSLDAASPVGLWQRQFALPSDFVRATKVWEYEVSDLGVVSHSIKFREDWKAEGSVLLAGEDGSPFTNATKKMGELCALAYVAYVETDLGLWSPGLRKCVVYKLAAELAVGTTGGIKFQNALDSKYERQLRHAQTLDTSREGNQLHRYSNDDFGSYGYSTHSNA